MNRGRSFAFAILVAWGLGPGRPVTAAPPVTTRPATVPTVAGDSPSTRPAGATGASPGATTTRPAVLAPAAVRAGFLAAQGIRALEAGRYDDGRRMLAAAVAIDPADPTALYNLACADSRTGHPAEAGNHLRAAAEAGFDDFAHMADDPDLAAVRDSPAVRDVLAHQGAYLHRAAERAMADLRRRFGDGYIYEIDDADKLVFATNTDRVTLAALKRDMVAQARSQWAQLFARRPQRFIAVVVPSAADYAKVRPSPNVAGFYAPATHTLIASGLGLVTTHEFTHALNFGDIEGTGQEDQPIWVTEGLAVLFEGAAFKGDHGDVLTPQPNQRLYELQALRRRNRLLPLRRLLAMRQADFMRNAGPGYAEAGSLMAYLYDRGDLRRFYERYKATWRRDRTGRVALLQVLQMTLPEVEQSWLAWVGRQTPPPLFTGPNGAYLGVRFDQGNDGLVMTEVVAGGAAATAGVRDGDVLVGLDDAEVRDRQAFVPLLATHKPGERVTLNLRRGTAYLNLPVVLGTRPALSPRAGAATRPTSRPTTGPTTRP